MPWAFIAQGIILLCLKVLHFKITLNYIANMVTCVIERIYNYPSYKSMNMFLHFSKRNNTKSGSKTPAIP